MAYKDKIYDITALDMAKRLERFLQNECKHGDMEERINNFYQRHVEKHGNKLMDKLCRQMHNIRQTRNQIVHSGEDDDLNRPYFPPVLGFLEFKQFQKECFRVHTSLFYNFNANLRMKDFMIPTLEYRMGNAGDLIKHGLLAEFAEWRVIDEKRISLQMADTFAGCPWEYLTPDDEVGTRLFGLKDCAMERAYRSGTNDLYLGSSHLVRHVAEKCKLSATIDMSDKDMNARCNLENSILEHHTMHLIRLPEGNDGYAILEKENWKRDYNLILIDPYSDFLRDEFSRVSSPKRLTKILNLVEEEGNEELFVAVFVLDMNKNNFVGKEFCKFKREKLRNCSFSLRCPKIAESNLGESRFDSEILLISKKIYDRKCDGLRSRLRAFADKATCVLPLSEGDKVEFFSPSC